jgi:hypothetical protein
MEETLLSCVVFEKHKIIYKKAGKNHKNFTFSWSKVRFWQPKVYFFLLYIKLTINIGMDGLRKVELLLDAGLCLGLMSSK